jgi:hypothetical protein
MGKPSFEIEEGGFSLDDVAPNYLFFWPNVGVTKTPAVADCAGRDLRQLAAVWELQAAEALCVWEWEKKERNSSSQ